MIPLFLVIELLSGEVIKLGKYHPLGGIFNNVPGYIMPQLSQHTQLFKKQLHLLLNLHLMHFEVL